jgi:hypothetical protein
VEEQRQEEKQEPELVEQEGEVDMHEIGQILMEGEASEDATCHTPPPPLAPRLAAGEPAGLSAHQREEGGQRPTPPSGLARSELGELWQNLADITDDEALKSYSSPGFRSPCFLKSPGIIGSGGQITTSAELALQAMDDS